MLILGLQAKYQKPCATKVGNSTVEVDILELGSYNNLAQLGKCPIFLLKSFLHPSASVISRPFFLTRMRSESPGYESDYCSSEFNDVIIAVRLLKTRSWRKITPRSPFRRLIMFYNWPTGRQLVLVSTVISTYSFFYTFYRDFQ